MRFVHVGLKDAPRLDRDVEGIGLLGVLAVDIQGNPLVVGSTGERRRGNDPARPVLDESAAVLPDGGVVVQPVRIGRIAPFFGNRYAPPPSVSFDEQPAASLLLLYLRDPKTPAFCGS